jgi:hypothetical protein
MIPETEIDSGFWADVVVESATRLNSKLRIFRMVFGVCIFVSLFRVASSITVYFDASSLSSYFFILNGNRSR